MKAVIRLSGWTVGFAAANQVALLIILSIARAGEAGTVSAYQYAFIFFQLPHGLIAVSLMTAVMPELAEAAVDRADSRFRSRFREGLSLLLTFMVPAAFGFVYIARPLVEVLLERGNLGSGGADDIAAMLVAFSVGLPAFSVFLYTCRAFYARRDTRTPFYLNLVENVINVAAGRAVPGLVRPRRARARATPWPTRSSPWCPSPSSTGGSAVSSISTMPCPCCAPSGSARPSGCPSCSWAS